MSGEPAEAVPYFRAAREDFLRALADPSRVQVVADLVALPFRVERVLDVGCGIGQALFPLAVSRGAYGVGVDINESALRMGRELYASRLPQAKVAFARATAESLPFDDESFDVANCGLALLYTDNASAVGEVARVLRPGGMFLLKIRHARFYLRLLWRGLARLEISSVIHGGRVLAAGALYHLTGQQPRAPSQRVVPDALAAAPGTDEARPAPRPRARQHEPADPLFRHLQEAGIARETIASAPAESRVGELSPQTHIPRRMWVSE